VSIIIPVRNRAVLLAQTLESLRRQSYENWEAIVVDDRSTDDTYKTAGAWAALDDRIRAIERPHRYRRGAPVCRNLGVAASRGQYVVFLDSDDLLAPECLEYRVRVMDDDPSLDFAVFMAALFRDRPGDLCLLWNRYTFEDDLDRMIRMDVPWGPHCPIWRRRALLRVGPWDERALSWQDWEFHVRALCRGLKYRKVERVDCYYRRSLHGIEQISKGNTRGLHLGSHERTLAKVTHMLRNSGRLDERRRDFLSGVYFQVARWYVADKRLGHALRLWTSCCRAGLTSWERYLHGVRHLCRNRLGPSVRAWISGRQLGAVSMRTCFRGLYYMGAIRGVGRRWVDLSEFERCPAEDVLLLERLPNTFLKATAGSCVNSPAERHRGAGDNLG